MERLLQDLIDLMPVGVWVADREGMFVRMNRAARRIWDAPDHVDLHALSAFRAWDPDTGEELKPGDWGLDRALGCGESVERLMRIRALDGVERTIASTVAPLYDEQGQLTGAVLVHEDLTELLAARMLGEERRELLQTVLDLLPVGVMRMDEQGRVVEANPAARRIWGLDEDGPLPPMADFTARDIATGEPVAPEEWASARALAQGVALRDELLEIRSFNGASRTIFNSAAPLYLHQTRPTGAIAINQDVSSLYRTQQQLRTAVFDREQLLATVAHDLRNPLAGLMLLASSIEQSAQEGTDLADIGVLAGRIRDRIHGLAGLVDDLLAISAGRLTDASVLDLHPTDPEPLVRRAVDQVKELFDARGIRLTMRIAPGVPAVMADVQRLQRVWTNLLDNALKHTQPGGEVVVGATVHGAVVFSVTNSGPALPREQLREMFRPFWQAARRDKRGVGLGLAIARAIVEAHGGSIWAEPAEGQRVSMKFELPRLELARPSQQEMRSIHLERGAV